MLAKVIRVILGEQNIAELHVENVDTWSLVKRETTCHMS
jgi:hypothetical protein